jgi:copper chaperone CopZ
MQNQDTMAGMQHNMDMQKDQKMEMAANQVHAMVKLPMVQCDMCKESIEQGLATLGGILSVHVDLEDKMAHINYDGTMLELKDIEQAIAKLGYQANDTPADPVAYAALPECCKVSE